MNILTFTFFFNGYQKAEIEVKDLKESKVVIKAILKDREYNCVRYDLVKDDFVLITFNDDKIADSKPVDTSKIRESIRKEKTK